MKLLAIESSTDLCSVALLTDASVIERTMSVPRNHTQVLLPLCAQVLAEGSLRLQDLDGIAFARGPGAFTGVRIAVSAAQGLALGAGIPVFAVSSLAALALGAAHYSGKPHVAVALDARMREVYWGCFTVDLVLGTAQAFIEECVCPAEDVLCPAGLPFIGAGSGWASYQTTLQKRCAGVPQAMIYPEIAPTAAAVARLARHELALDPMDAQPVYLRDRVVHTHG